MPVYNYECEGCGPFTAMQPMALFRDPQACPTCGAKAPRAMFSAPALIGARGEAGLTRQAIRAASPEPRRSSAAHPAGCGCCMRRTPLPGALSASGRVFTSHGPVGGGGQ